LIRRLIWIPGIHLKLSRMSSTVETTVPEPSHVDESFASSPAPAPLANPVRVTAEWEGEGGPCSTPGAAALLAGTGNCLSRAARKTPSSRAPGTRLPDETPADNIGRDALGNLSRQELEHLVMQNRTLAMENAMLQMKCWHVMSAVSAPPDPFSPYMSVGYLPYPPAFAPVQNGKQGRARPARENGVTIPEPEFGVAESGSDEPDLPGCPYVTVMLRNLPNNYSRAMLLELLDSEGFAGQYDFFYLPMDFKSRASLGYAFVNLVSTEQAARFRAHFDGFARWVLPSQKVCSVNWSAPYQGFDAHVERFRNSPVMHEAVPDEYKPVVFVNGARMPFPPPTKKLRAPRTRRGHGHAS